MPVQSVLDIMPLELFELILNTNRILDPTDYHRLRLLCRVANDVLEPHAFSTLNIRHTEHHITTSEDKLAAIALGTSPYSRRAKIIAFHRSLPDDDGNEDEGGEDNDEGDDDNDNPGRLEHDGAPVAQLLVNALKALKEIEAVSMVDTLPQMIHDDVLCILADYPSLKRLDLIPGQDGRPVPRTIFDRFSNLTSIRIIQRDPAIDPLCVDGAIARSTSLECLEIRSQLPDGFHNIPQWSLGALFKPALRGVPGFQPKLKSLDLHSPWLTLDPGAAPFLASLTRLSFNGMAEVSPGFWVAMAASAVRLKSLRAGRETNMGLVRYLTSYEGLQELGVYFGPHTEFVELDETLAASFAKAFFTQVLPSHKGSLQILNYDGEYGPWCCEAWLPQIFLCTLLKKLGVLCHYPSPRDGDAHRAIPVGELISKIVKELPQIARLSIKATRRKQVSADSLNIYRVREYFAAVCMTEAIIIAAEPPQWVVSTPIVDFTPVPGPIPGQYKLEMDPECAQFLHPPFSDPDGMSPDDTNTTV